MSILSHRARLQAGYHKTRKQLAEAERCVDGPIYFIEQLELPNRQVFKLYVKTYTE